LKLNFNILRLVYYFIKCLFGIPVLVLMSIGKFHFIENFNIKKIIEEAVFIEESDNYQTSILTLSLILTILLPIFILKTKSKMTMKISTSAILIIELSFNLFIIYFSALINTSHSASINHILLTLIFILFFSYQYLSNNLWISYSL
jgi:hypothetical protein